MNIILDTNFLLLCAKYKIDYIVELSRLFNKNYSILVPEQVVDELEDLSENRVGKERKVVEATISLLEQKIKKGQVKVMEMQAYDADEAIVELSAMSGNKGEVLVATLDAELRKKLKNAKFLTIKQKKYIYIV